MIDRNEEVTITIPYWMARFVLEHLHGGKRPQIITISGAAAAHQYGIMDSVDEFVAQPMDGILDKYEDGAQAAHEVITNAIVALEDKNGA